MIRKMKDAAKGPRLRKEVKTFEVLQPELALSTNWLKKWRIR